MDQPATHSLSQRCALGLMLAAAAFGEQLAVKVESRETTTILLTAPVAFAHTASCITPPSRIVVDLRAAGLMPAQQVQRVFAVNDARVSQIRVGGFAKGMARVVVDLAEGAGCVPFRVTRMSPDHSVQVTVGVATAPSAPPPAEPPSSALATPAPATSPTPAMASPGPVNQPPTLPPAASQIARPDLPAATADATPATAANPWQAAAAAPASASFFPRADRTGVVRELTLPLAEAIAMALENNPDLQASRVAVEQAAHRLQGARGVFDPLLSAASSFQKQVLPISNSLGGSDTGSVLSRTWQTTPSLTGAFPKFGGGYEVSFTGQRFSTNNLFATLNPNYPSALTFQFIQPLWRNRLYDARRHNITVEQKNQRMSRETFRRQVNETLAQTEHAYWEVSFARRELAVQWEAREIARRQEETNRRQVEQGQLAAIEAVAAQTQFANFEAAVFAAQEALTRAENRLKSLILGSRSAPAWGAALLTEPPPATLPALPLLEEAVAEALTARPEANEWQVAVEVNQANQRLHREELKPRVDLVARHTRTGLAGSISATAGGNPLGDSLTPALIRLNQLSAMAGLAPVGLGAPAAIPDLLVGRYGQSLTGLWAGDYPTSLLELRVALPLGNRTAQANLGLSAAEGRRLTFQKVKIDQLIEEEVRNAIQAMDSARARLAAARTKKKAAEEQFASEQRRFQQGATTLFLVQQRQLAMVTAQSQVNRAETDLVEAATALDLARAASARRHQVVVK